MAWWWWFKNKSHELNSEMVWKVSEILIIFSVEESLVGAEICTLSLILCMKGFSE